MRADYVVRPVDDTPREQHEWRYVATAPDGDRFRCARPGCKADPETAEPGEPCTGYDPEDD